MPATVQTNVRLPVGIKEWLRREAKRNRRSLSAEITYRLEQSRRAQEGAKNDSEPTR
ncbi:Arc family DNA-binding protein [Halomonas sp. McH1-25]|uniref:Arc family DNA-binding protein n=1 Tax=unclassified Halomonas TaxID=2609666 RepID=UPI001EF545D0|nr:MULTISPECIES: Arc family DNA-binding protein [unclassified Halomonas]MCG7598422.1 Arc family DNA-binding protein [Halomonas sp. McH1-25]MCP1343758.1 Arc family DNA-binding protein [Halomonas sp. FL8]MCP1361737.1 Arc family DNA-binding protein [Halomonas sp. BBD45]MCP1363995.1 Arc family DNA-binding protein [Halomonas sp. BBD48]